MAVQSLSQSLLVQEVPDKADRTAENKKSVQYASPDEVVRFLDGESPAAAEHIDEAYRDAPVHVEDQVGLFLGRNFLNFERVLWSKAELKEESLS